jgi:uncharacterized Zn ribbon protein
VFLAALQLARECPKTQHTTQTTATKSQLSVRSKSRVVSIAQGVTVTIIKTNKTKGENNVSTTAATIQRT